MRQTAGVAIAGERPNPDVTFESAKETPRQALVFALPIELASKRAKRVAVGEAARRAGDAELAATIVEVRNDVRRAYTDALVAEAKLGVLREMRDLAGRVRDTAQARFDAGDAPRLEVLQASLAYATAETEAATAEAAVRASRARLNAVLGQPLDTVQSLSTPVDAGASIGTDTVVEVARSRSAELALFDRQLDEQRARVTLAQSFRTPDIVPVFTLTQGAQPEFSYGWRAGVGVTVPLFTTHKAGAELEQATLDHAIALRAAALVRITGDVTAAAAAAEAHRLAHVRYRDVILPQAQQVEQLAQDSYRLGQTGIAALLQALQASRDVRLRSLETVAQFQTARADLERAMGAPLP